MTSEDIKSIFSELTKPFFLKDIEWKVQAKFPKQNPTHALMVTYADARVYQDRLDEVLGPQNWYDTYTSGAEGGVQCTLFVRLNGEWIGKTDGASNTDVEATKGGYTNAFKRACVKWGLGRFLYSIPSARVPLSNGYPQYTPHIPAELIRDDDPQREEYLSGTPSSATTKKVVKQKAGETKVAMTPEEKEKFELEVLFAQNRVIPDNIGVPLAGQRLGDAMNDAVFGESIINYLTGEYPNKAGIKFNPGDDKDLKELQKAAQTLYKSRTAK